MATYVTKEDLVRRVGPHQLAELTNDTDGRSVDDVVLDRIIADVQAEVDSYLRHRYTLPFDTAPAELTRIGCDMALYYVMRRRTGIDVTQYRDLYKDAIADLERLQAGRKVLDSVSTTPGTSSPTFIRHNGKSDGRTFSDDLLNRF
jgi:phage gp36-like protein